MSITVRQPFRQLFGRAMEIAGGIVDEDVQPPEALDDPGNGIAYREMIADVDRESDEFGPWHLAGELIDGRRKPLLPPAQNDDGGAELGIDTRDAQADAGTSPCYQRNSAVEKILAKNARTSFGAVVAGLCSFKGRIHRFPRGRVDRATRP